MTERSEIRDWLFRGLTVEDLLDDLEANGLAVRASTDPGALQRVIALEDFPPAVRQAAMKSLPIYLAFFCLENSVRNVVEERLLENYGSDWWNKCASKPMKEKVQKRQEKEGVHRWHVRRGASEIYYTDFGDLKDLLQNKWPDFEDLFPDQHWLTARFDELEASRNIIAHSNVLEDREVSRIKMYLEDWIRQVG